MEHQLKQCDYASDNREIKKVTWIGLLINISLAGLKFVVGILGHSQAVVADGVHSVSDTTTDLAVLLGVKYWSAPPDKDHPYGHWRIETIITGFIGLGLIAVALGIGYHAIKTIREVHTVQPSWIAIIGAAVSIVVKEILYRWNVQVGKKVRSSAVIANAWHHRSDALSSLPALIAVAVSVIKPAWAFLDHIGAIIVSLFILKISWDIIYKSLTKLSDKGVSQKEQQDIRRLALLVQGVKDAHEIRTRNVGKGLFVDLHVLVDGNLSVKTGHEIAEKVRDLLLEKGENILDVVVHIEPYE